MPIALDVPGELTPETAADVRALADRVETEDGAPPLSDQARTQLRSPLVRHVVARDGGHVVGYAQRDEDSVEIAAERGAVDPLLDAVFDEPGLIWSHGRRSRLLDHLDARGFTRQRGLLQLRRSLSAAVPLSDLPDDVAVEAFVVGRDEDDVLRVNAAAFAAHPEQGGWTRAELDAREAEAWFDPAGFLLARRDGVLVGFHWTKIHPDGTGEVYVIGIDPAAQGGGLGAGLLTRGLDSLRERGAAEVLLYVDDDNEPALAMYGRYGFGEYDVDAQWRAPAQTGAVSNT